MAITFQRAYVVGDRVFPTLERAQAAELQSLLSSISQITAESAATTIVQHAEEVLNILTTTDASHPRGRKANGASRKSRKAQANAAPEPELLPKTNAA